MRSAVGIILIVALVSFAVDAQAAAPFSLHVLDTSSGQICIIDMGDREIIIDGGVDGSELAEYLAATKIIDGPVELAVSMHASYHSFNGFRKTFLGKKGLPLNEYWDAGWIVTGPGDETESPFQRDLRSPTSSYLKFMRDIRAKADVTVHSPLADVHPPAALTGEVKPFAVRQLPGVRFHLLYARSTADRRGMRNQWPCLTLIIEIGSARIFISGHSSSRSLRGPDDESPTRVEARLLDVERQNPGALRADLLVVPDMGSNRTTTRTFVDTVDPRIVIVPGATRFNLPSEQVVNRVQKAGRTVFTVGLHPERARDNIVCTIAGRDIECAYSAIVAKEPPGYRATIQKTIRGKTRAVPIGDADLRDLLQSMQMSLERETCPLPELRPKDLRGADLRGADLADDSLRCFDLTGANLSWANLREANLAEANLKSADLAYARLDDASLRGASLEAVRSLRFVQARHADFHDAILAGSSLAHADLRGADLTNVDATSTDLSDADLRGTILRNTTFEKARATGARFERSLFELRPGGVPPSPQLTLSPNLNSLRFEESPHALVELRDGFKKAGAREKEGELTYAIRNGERLQTERKGRWLESRFQWLLFELPSGWGTKPGRLLYVLLLLWLTCGFLYYLMIRFGQNSGIRLVVTKRERRGSRVMGLRIRSAVPHAQKGSFFRRIVKRIRHEMLDFLTALGFSLRNTFSLKFQWLEAGTWLRMIQRRDFDLEGFGWARTMAGLQSLLSFYLIALWVLSYFGRPFE